MSVSPNRLEITEQGPCTVSVSGEIDAHSAPLLAEHLSGCTATDADIVIDMSAVTFMDSSGLRMLIDLRQRTESAPHDLVVRSPSDTVVRLLEVAGLDDHFTIAR
jgi:anti-anti-sigma factor